VGGRASTEECINLCTGGYRIGLVRGAVATSSTLHRRWATQDGIRHHIIDPARGRPAEHDWVMTSVVAHDTATADALATALLADSQRALKALRHVDADALLVSSGGGCFMTPGLQGYLR
jgi:thiamine biosynthesis lipoprotein